MLRYFFLALMLFPTLVFAKYKNTDGEAIDKSLKDLIRWQRNQKKPTLAYIDLSNEWQNINLQNENNYCPNERTIRQEGHKCFKE